MGRRAVIARRLQEARERSGLTQDQVVDRLNTHGRRRGLTRGTLSSWENGHTVPDADVLADLADLYDVSVDYVCGRSDEPHGIKGRAILVDEALFRRILAARNERELLACANDCVEPFTWWVDAPSSVVTVDPARLAEMEAAVRRHVEEIAPGFGLRWLRRVLEGSVRSDGEKRKGGSP